MLQRSGKPLPAHTLDNLASVVEGVADGSVGGDVWGKSADFRGSTGGCPIGNFAIFREIGIMMFAGTVFSDRHKAANNAIPTADTAISVI